MAGQEDPAGAGQPAARWTQQPQLPCSYFTLEDARLTKAAEAALSNFAVLSAGAPDLPVLYASSRCCDLCSCPREEVIGTSLAQALQLTPASQDSLAAALEHGAAVCLRLDAAQTIQAAFLPVADASSGLLLYWISCFGLHTAAEGRGGEEESAAACSGEAAVGADAEAWGQPPDFAPAVFTLAGGADGAKPSVEAVDEQFVELTGYKAAGLASAGHHTLFGPDTAPDVVAKLDAALAGRHPGAWPLLLYCASGASCRWCYLATFPLPGAQLCLVLDVTAASLARIGAYSVGRVIGQGTYGTVRVGRDAGTGELVALKMVDTRALKHLDELQQLQDEMSVLSALRHPRIIRLFGTQQVQERICFIMEYATGGSLKTYMDQQEGRVLSEARTKHLFEQMVGAVDYCHRRRVVHRDLKPENILLDENGDIKIADFGLAGITTPFDDNLSETCGTIEFTAPEVLSRQEYNGSAADMWSLGAVVYEMLVGRSPFKASNPAAIVKAACRGVYDPLPDHISPQCKDLLAGLLTVNPAARMTMEQVVCHPWLLGDVAPAGDEAGAAAPAGCSAMHQSCSCAAGGEGGGCSQHGLERLDSALSSGGTPSGISTRHNSLRLVVPGALDEQLPVVPEEDEPQTTDGSALPAKPSSPRRSLTSQISISGAGASPKTGSGGAGARESIRRSGSSSSAAGSSRAGSHSLRSPTSRSSSVASEGGGLHTVQLAFGPQGAQAGRQPGRSQRAAAS